jgi:hypothetical protein
MNYSYTSIFLKKQLSFKSAVLLLLVTFMGLSACKKEETDTTVYSNVAVYNTSPTAATYDIFLNGNRFNSAALPLGGGTAYSQVASGTYTLKVATAGRVESLLEKQATLAANVYTSIYVVGKPSALDFFQVSDDLGAATSTTNAFVRLVNVSPDAPALDLVVKNGASVTTSKSYKTASGFLPVPAGATIFEIRNSAGVVLASSESETLMANRHYTVIAKGLLAPTATETSFGAQLITHK